MLKDWSRRLNWIQPDSATASIARSEIVARQDDGPARLGGRHARRGRPGGDGGWRGLRLRRLTGGAADREQGNYAEAK